ncbi:MAG: AmmeMemoRadiSam system protein B [Candidatus Hydrogenedentes bacterium]|nr:AmmeMemoRadiSam system protein B [Candidatus Hydrogenedentota bacterium]
MHIDLRNYEKKSILILTFILINASCTAQIDEGKSESTGIKEGKPNIYTSLIAGRWYDSSPEKLKKEIESLFSEATNAPLENVIALILPHAGYAYSGKTAVKGIKSIGSKQYHRVIILGTSHRAPIENMVSIPTDVDFYETPLGKIPIDKEAINVISKSPYFKNIPIANLGEHSVEIELPLLQYSKQDFKLVPIVCGKLDFETTKKVANTLKKIIDENTLVIASSDFTHYGNNYGYKPFTDNIPDNLKKYDMGAYEYIEKKDLRGFYEYLDTTGITICGPYGIGVILSLLPTDIKVNLIDYTRSGDLTGDYNNSVSYLSIAITGTWEKGELGTMDTSSTLTPQEKRDLLKLARWTLEYVLDKGKLPSDSELPILLTDKMKEPGAVFVTLKIADDLRGCIGEIFATKPLYKSVIQNAYNAGFKDPRFFPITKDELKKIKIEISLLTPPRKINHYNEIELGKHGIILKKGYHQALFLPQVAPEQNWDLHQTLQHLSMKAGLLPDAYKEDAEFEVFEAEVFHED